MALFSVGGLGVVLAQIALGSPNAKDAPWFALAVEVASGLVWAIGCAISARALPIAWVADWPASLAASRQPTFNRPRMLLAAAAVVLGGLAGGMWYLGRFETPDATRGMLVWLLAVVLAGLACTSFRPPRRPSLLTLVPLVLFLVALAPRLWQVADLPYGIWYDEAQGALEVRRVTAPGHLYTHPEHVWQGHLGILLPDLGTLAGPRRWGAGRPHCGGPRRGADCPATYLLGRELFGWRVGLAAGIVLAFLRWHLNFSRLGFNPISLPLCATLAFWLLARAVRRKHWSDVAWAGLALGVGLHAYTGFRGMPWWRLVALAGAALLYRWSPVLMVRRASASTLVRQP